jgi:hypothetical protein
MTRAWLCRQEEASGQQIEPRSAIYVPFQHLQASDVPFDRALTPGQGDRCLNGGVVPTESSGETLEWLEATGGRARQPRVK